MTLPEYLLDHIAATTGIDHRVVSRKARRATCPQCRQAVLRGLDADAMAIDVRVDLVPLTPLGEMVARRAHLGTWVVSPAPPGVAVDFRDEYMLRAKPAGTLRRADVVPGHQCGRRWLKGCVTRSRIPRASAVTTSNEPPF